MKFRFVEDFDDFDYEMNEKFTSEHNKQSHYSKHKNQYRELTGDEYENVAETLMNSPVDNKKIFGYVSETDENRVAFCKYDKSTGNFVVYRIRNDIPETITMYNKSWQQYTGDKAIEYYNEIPAGK